MLLNATLKNDLSDIYKQNINYAVTDRPGHIKCRTAILVGRPLVKYVFNDLTNEIID
jgi:hypothetical protein